ncbi:paraquat-inducible protein A [Salinicola aestuarinus]|uniref:paraquat-inducible protein A n=1 Tax=Salinicola aestuarinus TaxID=1949082 RepID=UPI001FDA1BD8|nr:paraquat-inducible protein A [Salinicola aestuarinus]
MPPSDDRTHASTPARTDAQFRRTRRRLRACQECDLLVALPPLRAHECAKCPRCDHTLSHRHYRPAERSLALAITALIALAASVSFPFIRFEARGISNAIQLTDTASSLIGFREPFVGILVLLTIVVLPIFFLSAVIWLQIGLLRRAPLPRSRQIARALAHLTPWMMADVFVIGALVSLIKITGMASVELGLSFWSFCTFALLLLWTTRSLDTDWMWFSLESEPLAPAGCETGRPAAEQGVTGCPTCGLVNRLSHFGRGRCLRCREALRFRGPHSVQKTWALLVAAVIFYIPANVYPIMNTASLGNETASTIVGGVMIFIAHGDWPIALIIFIASVVVPIGKMISLAWLCFAVRRRDGADRRHKRLKLYRITEFIGRWSMIDVFVVAILVALVHAGSLLSITPGPGALAFAAVVVITMLAANTFDARLIWDSRDMQPKMPVALKRHSPYSPVKEAEDV